MSTNLSAGELRAEAQRLASLGAWGEVHSLLLGQQDAVRQSIECTALLAEALLRTGQSRVAGDWLSATLPTLRSTHDRRHFRRATMLWGAAYFEQGDLEQARDAFNSALELARADADDVVVARAMNNLGAIANIEGKWAEAMALYNLAVSAHQRLGNRRGLAECYHNMAITYRDLGRLEEADELEQRSVAHARDSDEFRLVAHARLGRAEIALRRGDPSLAEASARRVAKEFADAGDPVREADAWRLAGVACTKQGKFTESRILLDEALERTRELGALLNAAETLRARAELLAASGEPEMALADARSALLLFHQLGAEREYAAILRWIERLDLDEGL